MQRMDLAGPWRVHSKDEEHSLEAIVPGCIHLDLLAAGKIPDPFWRDNEKQVQWVSELTWIYGREFEATDVLSHEVVLLRCEGLDTLATLRLNGHELARTDNMFRRWEFDVTPFLKPGSNYLTVEFQPALPHTRQLQKQRYIHAWLSREDGVNYIRKIPCNYGWDWGPKLVTCGIWKAISIVAWNTARIANVAILQRHCAEAMCELEVQVLLDTHLSAIERSGSIPSAGGPTDDSTYLPHNTHMSYFVQVDVTLLHQDQVLSSTTLSADPRHIGTAKFSIEQPKLWWPNGMGDQPLYTVEAELRDRDGDLLDSWSRRIGLRTLSLECGNDGAGQSFHFSINGEPFFAKGANWIPADAFPTRLTGGDYRALLQSAADANMNMLRVWGGGIYERDTFYDLCDDLGICVWQDFMFACACYPTFDEAWMENVRIEAEQQVQRLRHHASLALWCGNNELEQGICGSDWSIHQMPWSEAARLFDELLPDVVRDFDPQRDYWPGSPHSPIGDRKLCNDPASGDAHLWSVWHGREPFEWYRTSQHRFCSEFGFQSFPEPKTIAAFALPEDQNISSYVMDFHQRSWVGNGVVTSYMLSWFRQPKDFDSFVWLSQILQGLAMKYAVEHWRRRMPRTMGALYWQLNDTWPGPSWSSIDYFHRWKALHYMARRFFAPLLVSLVEDVERRTVEVWITSDLRNPAEAVLRTSITDCAGKLLHESSRSVSPSQQRSTCVYTLQIDLLISRELDWGHISPVPQLTPGGVRVDQGIGPRDIIIWAELEIDRTVVSRNAATFAKPKHLELRDPELQVEWNHAPPGVPPSFNLRAKHPALYIWFELQDIDARFSDNFFDLRAGESMRVAIQTTAPYDLLARALKVRSMYDTY